MKNNFSLLFILKQKQKKYFSKDQIKSWAVISKNPLAVLKVHYRWFIVLSLEIKRIEKSRNYSEAFKPFVQLYFSLETLKRVHGCYDAMCWLSKQYPK